LHGFSQATARGLYRSLSYDPITDFAPVAFICSYSFFMFVPNSLANNLPRKQTRGEIYARSNFASAPTAFLNAPAVKREAEENWSKGRWK
jgi:hypothetical protein